MTSCKQATGMLTACLFSHICLSGSCLAGVDTPLSVQLSYEDPHIEGNVGHLPESWSNLSQVSY